MYEWKENTKIGVNGKWMTGRMDEHRELTYYRMNEQNEQKRKWMEEWMDGMSEWRMNKLMEKWIEEWMEEWMHIIMNKLNESMNGWDMDEWMSRFSNGQQDEWWMNEWKSEWMSRGRRTRDQAEWMDELEEHINEETSTHDTVLYQLTAGLGEGKRNTFCKKRTDHVSRRHPVPEIRQSFFNRQQLRTYGNIHHSSDISRYKVKWYNTITRHQTSVLSESAIGSATHAHTLTACVEQRDAGQH